MECPECKTVNNEGANQCKKCGIKVKKCPNCNAVNIENANYCHMCQYLFNEVKNQPKKEVKKSANLSKKKSTLFKQKIDETEFFINIDNSYIELNEDRLRHYLIDYTKKIKKKNENWIALFAISIAIFTTLVTSTFKDVFFSAETWKDIFIIGGFASLVFLAKALIHAYIFNKINEDQLISDIKAEEKTYEKPTKKNSCNAKKRVR